MENLIVAMIKPTEPTQYVYVFTEDSDLTPISIPATMETLLSTITMNAAKYKLKNIKLSGPKAFTMGIKDQLTEKINTCFGKTDDFTIELM
jgi:hypothetical protein